MHNFLCLLLEVFIHLFPSHFCFQNFCSQFFLFFVFIDYLFIFLSFGFVLSCLFVYLGFLLFFVVFRLFFFFFFFFCPSVISFTIGITSCYKQVFFALFVYTSSPLIVVSFQYLMLVNPLPLFFQLIESVYECVISGVMCSASSSIFLFFGSFVWVSPLFIFFTFFERVIERLLFTWFQETFPPGSTCYIT